MKVNVNKGKCIGCGACVGLCPEVFDFGDDGLAESKVDKVPDDKESVATEAVGYCPVGAITKE